MISTLKKITLFNVLVFLLYTSLNYGQENTPIINNLGEVDNEVGTHHYWLQMGNNTYNYPILIPVIVIQGAIDGPTIGLTAAIHGNELNGIKIIHSLVEKIDPKLLKGRIIAIPGLNAISIQNDERRFIDEEDLNRNFPGNKNGNRSEQYAFKISEKILPYFNFHIDMHTASFGRTNTMYARADMLNDTLAKLAKLQQPDIILNSKGIPSVGSAEARTMRAEAVLKNIPSITVEYGNPQVFQKEMIERGLKGILNTLGWLNMYGKNNVEQINDSAVYCKKSYWLFMEEGGFLEVTVELNQQIKKGETIAIVRNAFGKIIKKYTAPENGIVIGKSSNPANMSGGRIIHLGILN